MKIHKVIEQLLKEYTPDDIAISVGVSNAMISTWKNKDNDFVPRLSLARKFWNKYSVVIYPYSEEAVRDEA
jgi:hypothetical protein